MKASFILFSFFLASNAAFAVNPCKHERLKTYVCEFTDSERNTSATVEIYRSVSAGGRRPSCTTGEIQEGVLARVSYRNLAGESRTGLLVAQRNSDRLSMERLEKSGRIDDVWFESGNDMEFEDGVESNFRAYEQTGQVSANFDFKATTLAGNPSGKTQVVALRVEAAKCQAKP